MLFYQILPYKTSCKSNKFKISVATWHEKFEFFDGSYSVSDI